MCKQSHQILFSWKNSSIVKRPGSRSFSFTLKQEGGNRDMSDDAQTIQSAIQLIEIGGRVTMLLSAVS